MWTALRLRSAQASWLLALQMTVALARTALRRAPTDEALFRVVNRGISGTGMPGNAMSARETWQVVAFVRSLGRVKREPLRGDAARGARVYETAGCAACHTIRGRG